MANILRKEDSLERRLDSGKVDLEAGRRAFLGTLAAATIGATALATTGGALAQASGPTAADVFNFALNLEYLEAEFYVRAAFNRGLADADVTGLGNLGGVTGGRQIEDFANPANFVIRNYARELANDEEAHVRYLRNILGSARVARPTIDLINSFNALARVSGLVPPNGTFDAFGSTTAFLLASFVFEDVGVTAYKGAIPLIRNNEFLEGVAGIALAEAYHAGVIRAVINGRGLFDQARAISDTRDFLDGSGTDTDQGAGNANASNILPADGNALPYSRTPAQVLAVVYADGLGRPGGFFPQGVNGAVR